MTNREKLLELYLKKHPIKDEDDKAIFELISNYMLTTMPMKDVFRYLRKLK